MNLSPTQSSAIDAVAKWYADPHAPQVFRLFGYAGTGKTTLAKHFASGLNTPLFAAYTGKAALQMAKNGCTGASTIHSLTYKLEQPDKTAIRELEEQYFETKDKSLWKDLLELRKPHFILNRESPLYSADLLIVDECSMVDEEMGEDLLSFGKKVLVLGDPLQLPPIKGQGFFTSAPPDILLSEIHRQAADNPIIAMSMEVRERGYLPQWRSGPARVGGASDIAISKLQSYSQLLVGKNATRHKANAKLRKSYNRVSEYPVPGDRLIALRNYKDVGLFNGMFLEVKEAEWEVGSSFDLPLTVETELGKVLEEARFLSPRFVEGENPELLKMVPWRVAKELYDADYGYAITVHKAQGSQFDDVLLIDDGMFGWDPEMRKRWLYTAITRAVETFTCVRVRTI